MDKWFLGEKSDGRLGKCSQCNVPRPIQKAWVKSQDLIKYDTSLVLFDGRVVIPEGQISLPMIMEGKEVMVAFIMVSSFSPYAAILSRPWIHTIGVVPSTLHVKVKFRTEQGVAVVQGSQTAAKQCLVTEG